MNFHRNPSKVWWASDDSTDWSHRSTSSSPRSQDSGFSDSETSHNIEKQNKTSSGKQDTAKKLNIVKDSSPSDRNLSKDVKEKPTPNKRSFHRNINPDARYLNTPVRKIVPEVRSEPVNGFKYAKHSPKISRNLFRSARLDSSRSSIVTNQYSWERRSVHESSISKNLTYDEVNSSFNSVEEANVTVPVVCKRNKIDFNVSAPAILTEDEDAVASFNSLSPIQSDTDSEIECLFTTCSVDSPKHTSTPKVFLKPATPKTNKKKMNLLLQYRHERVPPISIHNIEDGTALNNWVQETRQLYEAECMTTLQSKSIAADLADKVSLAASIVTSSLRQLLFEMRTIEEEFENVKTHPKHKDALIQSITGLIKEFIEKYSIQNNKNLKRYIDDLKIFKLDDNLTKLQNSFNIQTQKLLEFQITKLSEGLEDTSSEIDLRAKLTGLTWISQRNPTVLDLLTKSTTAIQTLVILCEKCDGSSVRALALRALSTLCYNSSGIRQFERASGIQTISDIIAESSRPEPERSEAVALLAQITAPWIEDNHKINGLQERSKQLVKYLTDFLENTRCCQNLLLCAAALANLTAMEVRSIKYILHQNTIKALLHAVKSRGPMASVYLLEQAATLIANVSAIEGARKQLARDEVPKALLCFLQTNYFEEDLVKRLQQKSIIALSRLCGEPEAAIQIVDLQGVEKLVHLCREKTARYNSDAVLVATLATLRKIAEACGASVIDAQDAQELVEPRLLDSFLAYSTQNESLV